MDNIFYTDNQYPLGGLMPISIPAVVSGIGRKLRDRMYRTIRPESYTAENALNFLKGEPRVYRDPNSEALLGKYTAQDSIIADSSQAPDGFVGGRPLTSAEHKAIGDSIMLGGAENLRKYAVNDLIIPSKSKEGAFEFAYPNQSGNTPHLPVNYNDVPQSRWTHSKQLGSYYQSKGQDDKGNSITYEDTWDINPWRGKSSSDDPTSAWQTVINIGRNIGLDNIGDVVPFGRPFEIHGKQYYDKKGKPVKQKAEGGSLKEKSAWDSLSMAEKAEMMKVAVRNGITTLPEIRAKYNEFAEGGSKEEEEEVNTNSYSVGNLVNALYQNNPKEKHLGEPEHHYDFTQSEEWANAHGYYPDARGHRDDRVKKSTHPSHPSRGVWNGDKFVLTDFGMQNPNYTLFGLNDGGQDPQATLIYNNSVVLPELTVTPNENYFFNPYDNIELHYAKGGGIRIAPSKKGTFTAAASKHGKSVQEFASQVLAHKENYSPAMVKKANFARNSRCWKHGLGGNLFDDGGFLDKVTEALEGIPSPEEVAKRTSAGVMQYARQIYNGANANPFTHNWMPELDDDTHTGGIAQRTYLLPRSWQEKEFLNNGYIKGKEGDYGLVKKAVGNRELPVYQTAQDAISRDQLIPLGNIDNMWYGDKRSELEHPGSYPTAVYTDGQGNFYQKAWDLNDYGGENGSTTSVLGKVADFIGSPVVVTTGFQKIDKDRWNTGVILKDMMSKKGLVPTKIEGKTEWTLPEVTVVGKRKKHGLGGNLFSGGENLFAYGGELGNYYDGWGDFKNFLKKAYHGAKQFVGLEDTPKEASLKKGQARYSQYGYIGGEPRETRQKYFNLDTELTDSVNSISKRYGLNPSIVASRMAEEGPIDAAINEYNDIENNGTRGLILSDNNRGTHGPLWGLDDFYSRNKEGKTKITTTAPHSFKKHMFINEHGRLTESIVSPQWWFGIEATASEMKARRDKLKKNNPWMDNKTLDAATAMSFNYGEWGTQKYINKKKSIPKKFNPYIKTK